MTEAILIATVVATIAFMMVCFTTDIRERTIYVFPCVMLAVIWGVIGISNSYDFSNVIIVVLIHIFVYCILRISQIWGDGDSDMFLLFGAVYGAFVLNQCWEISALTYAIGELIGMIAALLISFVVGFVESLIKKEKITRTSSIAVVPGFTVVIIGMLIAMVVKG